jgi:hypothetical protein
MTGARPKKRLSRKYVVVLVTLVGGVLVASGLVELYRPTRNPARRHQRATREGVPGGRAHRAVRRRNRATCAGTTRGNGSVPADLGCERLCDTGRRRSFIAEQREIGFLQVLRNVPAVMELRHLDELGRERIRVSRLART